MDVKFLRLYNLIYAIHSALFGSDKEYEMTTSYENAVAMLEEILEMQG